VRCVGHLVQLVLFVVAWLMVRYRHMHVIYYNTREKELKYLCLFVGRTRADRQLVKTCSLKFMTTTAYVRCLVIIACNKTSFTYFSYWLHTVLY